MLTAADRVNMPGMMLEFTMEILEQRIDQGYMGILMLMNDETEDITYDTLAGRIMRVDIDTGEILGAMERPDSLNAR